MLHLPFRRLAVTLARTIGITTVAIALGAGNCGPANDPDDPVDACDMVGGCNPSTGAGTGGGSTGGSDGGGVVIVDDGLRPAAWRAFEADVVTRVNALRAAGGSCGSGADVTTFAASGPLRVDARLTDAARGHADDMGARGYFDHVGLDGRSPFDRMLDAGYTAFAAAENIAAGQTSPAEVVEGWRTSPGHCRNLYNGDLNEVGVGYALVTGSRYGHYWVQNFGQR